MLVIYKRQSRDRGRKKGGVVIDAHGHAWVPKLFVDIAEGNRSLESR